MKKKIFTLFNKYLNLIFYYNLTNYNFTNIYKKFSNQLQMTLVNIDVIFEMI